MNNLITKYMPLHIRDLLKTITLLGVGQLAGGGKCN